MYTVYVDDNLLYAPELANEGYGVVNPKVTKELNKAGSFSFVLPPGNALYDSIKKLKSILSVYEDGDEIFRGRILHDKKDFYNRKNVYCEGELAFLLDSVQRPYSFSGNVWEEYLTVHNEQVDREKQFQIGDMDVIDTGETVTCSNSEYSDTWVEINNLLSKYGGYLRTRKVDNLHYLDWVKDYGHVCSQAIEFGRNLLDLTEYINAQEVYTYLIPLGAMMDGKRLTVEAVNDGKDFVKDTEAAALFGKIWKVKIWDDITSAEKLLEVGNADLKANIEMSVTLEIEAVDLRHAGVEVEHIRLGDYVRVVSIPHGLDKYFLCSKIVYDLVNPAKTRYTFGITYKALTEQQANDTKALHGSFVITQNMAKEAENSANQAVQKVEEVIVEMPTNYVTTEVFETYKEEISEKLSVVYRFKGSADTYELLPTEGLMVGDVYNLLDSGANYAWTENGWDKLSETVDMSGYVTLEAYQTLEERVKILEGGDT